MKNSGAESVTLLRLMISDAARQDQHITWPAVNAKQRNDLKCLEALAAGLQRRMGDRVRLQAFEQTDGSRVEIILVATFDHPELPLGSSSADAIQQQFREAYQVLRQVAASPLPAELISISSGDPRNSSQTNVLATQEIADLANVLRKHLPESGVEIELDSAVSSSIFPRRGASQPLRDDKELVLSGEILAVNDKARTTLIRTHEGPLTELNFPSTGRHRERLLQAQLHRRTVELRLNPTYRIENGTYKMRGGMLLEVLREIDNPIQGDLVD